MTKGRRVIALVFKGAFCLFLAWALVLFIFGHINAFLIANTGVSLPFGLLILPFAIAIFVLFTRLEKSRPD